MVYVSKYQLFLEKYNFRIVMISLLWVAREEQWENLWIQVLV
jgi:hypothetical protein